MEECFWAGGCIFIGLFLGLIVGIGISTPQELENGCFVNDGKIFCEKVEVNE